jgi:pseudouridine 5'-phosphatase
MTVGKFKNFEQQRPQITHVIFDMDGVLLDTEPIYHEVTEGILQRFGKTFDFSVRSRMMGRPALDSAKILIEATKIPMTPSEYLETRDPLQNERFKTCKLLPGVLRLVQHLEQHRIPIAVATSSSRLPFQYKTHHNRHLFDLFDVIITSDNPNVKQGKPAPDVYLEAQRRLAIKRNLSLSSDAALVFEDTISGMRAALAAGMSVVLLPDPQLQDAGMFDAHEILTSMELFRPDSWNLPSYSI